MNIERLIEAAKEIDRLSQMQEDRTIKLQQLANESRNVASNSREHNDLRIKANALTTTVIDFGNAIRNLRLALRARPKKSKDQ